MPPYARCLPFLLVASLAFAQAKPSSATPDSRPSRFAELLACNPEAAARIMASKSHDMAKGEVNDGVGREIRWPSAEEGTTTVQIFGTKGATSSAVKSATVSAEEIEPLLAACKNKGYVGTGTVTTEEFTIVTNVIWRIEKASGMLQTYRPSSGIATITFNGLPCTYAPSSVPLDLKSGLLRINYESTPPTFSGYGKSNITLNIFCPDDPPRPFHGLTLYLGLMGGEAAGQLKAGGLIEGTQHDEDATVTWEYRSCNPDLPDSTMPGSCKFSAPNTKALPRPNN